LGATRSEHADLLDRIPGFLAPEQRLDFSVKACQYHWAWIRDFYSIQRQHRRVPAREAREYRVPRAIRSIMDCRMPAMDVENKQCPSRAEELPLCRVWFARVVAGS
jgi:hypothetical protein